MLTSGNINHTFERATIMIDKQVASRKKDNRTIFNDANSVFWILVIYIGLVKLGLITFVRLSLKASTISLLVKIGIDSLCLMTTKANLTYSFILDRNGKLRKEHQSKVTLIIVLTFIVALSTVITLLVKFVMIDIRTFH